MVRRSVTLLALTLVVTGCRVVAGIDEDVSVSTTEPGSGECPHDHGGAMQRVPYAGGQVCVDAREVSLTDWQEFTAGAGSSLDPWLATTDTACGLRRGTPPSAGDTSVTTLVGFEPADVPKLPVVGVDVCDARAYCAWAGKRLCAGDPTQPFDAARDEWTNACTSSGKYRYGYAATQDDARCTGIRRTNPLGCGGAECETTPTDYVSPNGGCTSPDAPFRGLYDLVGNVWEWTDACYQEAGQTYCLRRGGSFASEYQGDATPGGRWYEIQCLIAYTEGGRAAPGNPALDPSNDVGFRCCADAR